MRKNHYKYLMKARNKQEILRIYNNFINSLSKFSLINNKIVNLQTMIEV